MIQYSVWMQSSVLLHFAFFLFPPRIYFLFLHYFLYFTLGKENIKQAKVLMALSHWARSKIETLL